MIDLTKPLPKPIRNDFLENVLDGIDREKANEDNLDNLPLDQLNKLLEEMDDNMGSVTPVDDIGRVVGGRVESSPTKNKWWVETDEKGLPTTPKYDKGDPITKILVAPYYLVHYVIKSIEHNKTTAKNDMIPFLKSMFMCFGVTAVFSILLIIYDLNFIVGAKELAIISFVISASSKAILHIKYDNEDEEYGESPEEDFFEESEESEELDDFEIFEDEEYVDDSIDYGDDDDDYDDYDMYDESITEGKKLAQAKKEYSKRMALDEHIIPPGTSEDEFNDNILKAFLGNSNNRGKVYKTREDIIKSFNPYILCNNPGFSESRDIRKGSVVYNNINYLIYEGLRGIYTNLTFTGEYVMEVRSVIENQLYYKVEVILPKIIKLHTVIKGLDVLESKFKAYESDNEVDVNVTAYADTFVFRVKKPSNSIVTWGDVIRYYDPVTGIKTYEQFMDEDKYRFPVMAGLQNDEAPVIFDLAQNTSIAVAGTSGSGKSWVVYSLLYNILIQSHPGDANFIILDFKGDPQYMEFARMPHVVGYHGDIDRYNDYIKEVVLELNRRKKITKAMGISKWDDIRAKFKNDPEKLHKFPWLFIIVEETAAVLSSLESASKKTELRDEFIRNLKEVAKQGRSLGMRIIMISQRTTSAELPRDIEAECGVKFTLKLKDADLERVEMLPPGVVPPRRKGVAVFKEEFLTEPIVLKALGIGGLNDDQIKNLTRIMAFDWNLRVSDEELAGQYPTFKVTDNRKVRREEVFKDLSEENYFIDIESIDIDDVMSIVDGKKPKTKPKKEDSWESIETNDDEEFFFVPEGYDDDSSDDFEEFTADEDSDEGLVDIDELTEEIVDIDKLVSKEPEEKSKVKKPYTGGMMGAKVQSKKKPETVDKDPVDKVLEVKPVVDKHTENSKVKSSSEVKDKSKVPVKKASERVKKKKSIVEFIRVYGEKDQLSGASKIKHEKLVKFYDKEEIMDALNNIEIVDQEGYFIT